MNSDEFRRYGHQLIDWAANYLEDAGNYPVLSRVKPGELIDALPAQGPAAPEPMAAILEDFERHILPALTHWNHPGFLAYFATSAAPPGILAELLTAVLNSNGILWKSSPAVTELEVVTLGWLREWIGLTEDWFGLIFDTASIGSLHAILAARESAAPEIREQGGGPRLTVYASEHAHSSIEKAVIAAGIGRQNFRKIATDDQYRMRPDALRQALAEDAAAGAKPCCVVATIGTTSMTSIDPVRELVAIAREYGAWVHVDAAYAGSAAIAPEFQYFLEGVNGADSLVVNPHKWLFTPLDCSILYTRRPEILRRAFSLVPEYLRSQEDPRLLNLMEYAIPLGRRFRALKLWFILRYYGREGLARVIREQIAIAKELAAQVEADPEFELMAPVELSVVCLRARRLTDAQNQQVLDRVNALGEVFLSHTVFAGRYVIRVAIGNIGTTREVVQRAWKLIRDETAVLSSASEGLR